MNDIEQIINNKENYIAKGMEKFIVDDITYTSYSEYSFIWEKTYVENPERADNGAMGDLNAENATFVTPRMVVTYNLMSIDDYRSIMKQLLSKNEFVVTCYDPINDKMTTNKMYFATASMPDFYYVDETDSDGNKVVSLVGVRDYKIELIGTNNPIE